MTGVNSGSLGIATILKYKMSLEIYISDSHKTFHSKCTDMWPIVDNMFWAVTRGCRGHAIITRRCRSNVRSSIMKNKNSFSPAFSAGRFYYSEILVWKRYSRLYVDILPTTLFTLVYVLNTESYLCVYDGIYVCFGVQAYLLYFRM